MDSDMIVERGCFVEVEVGIDIVRAIGTAKGTDFVDTVAGM